MEFLEKLMQVIVDEGTQTPKAQVERYISPILGIFLEEILKKTFHKEYQMIVPEFPIRDGMIHKEGTNQSTNIDYLMFNKTDNKFVFIELKTDSKSFKLSQFDIYQELKDLCKNSNEIFGNQLFESLEKIKKHSIAKTKYQYLIDKLNVIPSVKTINDMEIIYLVPAKTKLKEKQDLGILYFNDLPTELPLFSKEWKIILEYLKKLDIN